MNSPQLSLSRRLRKSPFETRSHVGATRASVYNHVVLPTVYESLEADYWHLREHVQIWDVACQVQVEVRGPDALRFVEFLTPRDVSKCVPGQCIYAPLLDEHAGVVNDPIILCLSTDHYWLSISDSDVLLWAKGLAVGGGFDVEVHDPNVFPLSLQGPKSEALLSRLIAEPVEDIRFFRFIHSRIDDIELVVARTGWSGQGGFELYLSEPAEGERLWDIIVEAGTDLNLRSGCPNLIDRIETGLLSHGNDVMLANNPIESGLNRFFKMGKDADYLGKQALEKIVAEGTPQQFVRLVFPGDPIANPRETYPLSVSGTAEAGHVTSVIFSPRLGHNVGLGYVPSSATAVGTTVTLSLPSGTVSGNIADKDWHTEPTQ